MTMRPYDVPRTRNDGERCNKNKSFNIQPSILFVTSGNSGDSADRARAPLNSDSSGRFNVLLNIKGWLVLNLLF